MAPDILRDLGPVFLGSRLKRLGERLQAGAAEVIAAAGLPLQPAHMPLLATLDGRSLTIGQLVDALQISQPGVTRGIAQLVELGLVVSTPGTDQRRRIVSLTAQGVAAMAIARARVFPRIGAAVEQLCEGRGADLLATLAALEEALAARPLAPLAASLAAPALTILDYAPEHAQAFHDIGAEWIGSMFRLEETDRHVLEHPEEAIIAPGGAILFVAAEGLGVIGTCALQKTGARSFELTKMGVRPAARGLKAGAVLLDAAIARAQALGADPLYLLTSARCTTAIHLYEKHGFVHDAAIMADHGARYARCDVAMRYVGQRPGAA